MRTEDSPISSRPMRCSIATRRTPDHRVRISAPISHIFASAMGACASYSRNFTPRPSVSLRTTRSPPSPLPEPRPRAARARWLHGTGQRDGLELARRNRLEAVGLPAAAARLHVRILDREAGAHHVVFDEIDFAALDIRDAVRVDVNLDAVRIDDV